MSNDGRPSRAPRAATAEHVRLAEAERGTKWRRWGTYLSERQWGTVREDYSANGDAWNYFPHEHARSRAYRWGEDGMLGLSDSRGIFNVAVALWNGKDPYLKERLFGLSGPEGNHGETVGELYWYLDATPTCSYARALYKYPQGEFPYEKLRQMAKERGRQEPSPRVIETGAFDEDRYFDVEIEYAKATWEDVLVSVRVTNRGPERATIDVLPTFWYRNTWGWDGASPKGKKDRPELRAAYGDGPHAPQIEAQDAYHGTTRIWVDGAKELLFTDNETNTSLLYGTPNKSSYVKDAFHAYVVKGQRSAVSPARAGTKAAARWTLELAPGETKVVRARLSVRERSPGEQPFADFDDVFAARRREADEFYAAITPRTSPARRATCTVRRSRASSGRSSTTATTSSAGSPETRADRPLRPSAGAAGTASGGTSSTARCSPCPTSGSTPGTPRGISRSTASRCRSSIRRSRRSSSCS